jgi:hypothetical protein
MYFIACASIRGFCFKLAALFVTLILPLHLIATFPVMIHRPVGQNRLPAPRSKSKTLHPFKSVAKFVQTY